MFLLGFRRKLTALVLCKSIARLLYSGFRYTFATIQNSAVYLPGARVRIVSTLVPRLYVWHIRKYSVNSVTFVRVCFCETSHNYAKFRENKMLAKWQNHSVNY